MIEASVIGPKIPVDRIIQVLGQHIHLSHEQSNTMIHFLHSLERKINISLYKIDNWTVNDCTEEKKGKKSKFMEIEVPNEAYSFIQVLMDEADKQMSQPTESEVCKCYTIKEYDHFQHESNAGGLTTHQ